MKLVTVIFWGRRERLVRFILVRRREMILQLVRHRLTVIHVLLRLVVQGFRLQQTEVLNSKSRPSSRLRYRGVGLERKTLVSSPTLG